MRLKDLINKYKLLGCDRLFVKSLSENDNSKNQVYFGHDFTAVNVFPRENIDESSRIHKAKVKFSWIDDEANVFNASSAQLIFYPQYPEVRFSGFLKGCEKCPSELMRSRLANRLLFIGINNENLYGYVVSQENPISKEFEQIPDLPHYSVFLDATSLLAGEDSKTRLLNELKHIWSKGWIVSKRLDSGGNILPCRQRNCGGYTLEAELGIKPNAYSEPDFLGWEVKQYSVPNIEKPTSNRITLMTPEPSGGLYKINGLHTFIEKYGYDDKKNPNRRNFSSPHYFQKKNDLTSLKLQIVGFDTEKNKISDIENGGIVLCDSNRQHAALWDFNKLYEHWNRKHNQAVFIPSQLRKNGEQYYMYSPYVTLGIGTDFTLFIKAIMDRQIVYDPGIKIEDFNSSSEKSHRRSQFRISSNKLSNLYLNYEQIDLRTI